MNKKSLLRVDIIICVIITIGFVMTSLLGYRANYGMLAQDLEHVVSLAADSIYTKIDAIFTRPVSVSLTMANDSLLKRFLAKEAEHLADPDYVAELREYLDAYRVKYGYDSVFLVSSATRRYYHFNGLDRVLIQGDPENEWYDAFLAEKGDYSLNVDNDEAAQNSITVFINCKVTDAEGEIMGVVGVGLRVNTLQELLREYNGQFQAQAMLVSGDGTVQVSTEKTGYDLVSLFDRPGLAPLRDTLLNPSAKQAQWYKGAEKGYISSQYVPTLEWFLIVDSDATVFEGKLNMQLLSDLLLIAVTILAVLMIVSRMLRRYNKQLTALTIAPQLEYQRMLRETTEGFYENILEVNVTENRFSGETAKQYLKSLEGNANMPFDQTLLLIAKKKIKEEYVDGYLEMFAPTRILEAHARGVDLLTYDMLVHAQNESYRWVRITARIFQQATDGTVWLISYQQDIDEIKRRELTLIERTRRDSLTGLLNKSATEEQAAASLSGQGEDSCIAMLLMDIDEFKQVNDSMGHAFGDTVLEEFAGELQSHFMESDVVGRVGGDEFAVVVRDYGDTSQLRAKLERFCDRLARKNFGKVYTLSASIGVALYPTHGTTYRALYENADQALYYAKAHGKGFFQFCGNQTEDGAAGHMDPRVMDVLVNAATDGISKAACMDDGKFRLLYFNAKRAKLTDTPAKILSSPEFDVLAQIHPDDLPGALEVFQQAMPHRESFAVNLRIQHAEGYYIPVKLSGLFVGETYQGCYPIFYALYTKLS